MSLQRSGEYGYVKQTLAYKMISIKRNKSAVLRIAGVITTLFCILLIASILAYLLTPWILLTVIPFVIFAIARITRDFIIPRRRSVELLADMSVSDLKKLDSEIERGKSLGNGVLTSNYIITSNTIIKYTDIEQIVVDEYSSSFLSDFLFYILDPCYFIFDILNICGDKGGLPMIIFYTKDQKPSRIRKKLSQIHAIFIPEDIDMDLIDSAVAEIRFHAGDIKYIRYL